MSASVQNYLACKTYPRTGKGPCDELRANLSIRILECKAYAGSVAGEVLNPARLLRDQQLPIIRVVGDEFSVYLVGAMRRFTIIFTCPNVVKKQLRPLDIPVD
jgi:hypothetical protein